MFLANIKATMKKCMEFGHNMNLISDIILSWDCCADNGEIADILDWVDQKNKELVVNITKNKLSESGSWFYDEKTGEIRNKNNSFFQIRGLQQYREDQLVMEQPILIQNEIGYLGVLCKKINGVLHFLMQAKIEPGNVNKIQISPTIQATKSNFMQKHGGKRPAYLDYFLNARPENILVDQIQSEQSMRFLGKRNRNIIVFVDEDVEVLSSHRWMTLGTIKCLMKCDNLVNMDTRTVLSCIPYSVTPISNEEKREISELFSDKALFYSMFSLPRHSDIVKVFRHINNYKMLHGCENKFVPLAEMHTWDFTDSGIVRKSGYPFKVIFCDIEIEGREVTHWSQPLFEAEGMATFGLIICEFDGVLKFLVQAKPEVGCFDSIELAPTVQLEATLTKEEYSEIDRLFFTLMENGTEIRNDVILSEEGGRFYHEQNRNLILRVSQNQIGKLPEGYFWLDYATLNELVQYNNILNIQLRNLLSLLEI